MNYLLKIICNIIEHAFEDEGAVGISVVMKLPSNQEFVNVISELFVQKEGYLVIDGIEPDKLEHPKNLHLSGDVEKAVEWRNQKSAQGHIIFCCGKLNRRSHSLEDFYKITPSDIVKAIAHDQCINAQNEPIKRFWEAIENLENGRDMLFSLSNLLDFLEATNGKKSGFEKELWRLKLIPDMKILSPSVNPIDRILRNRDLIIEHINSLDDAVRNRMAASLVHFNKKEKQTYRLLLDFFRNGDINSLKGLDLDQVLSIITKTKTQSDQTKKETKENETGEETTEQNSGVKPQSAQKTVLDDFVNGLTGDKKAWDRIKEFGASIIDYTNNHDPFDDVSPGEKPSIEDPQTGTTVAYPTAKLDRNLYKLVMKSCSIPNWGGVILCNQTNLHDAIAEAETICNDSEVFNPFCPCIDESNPFFTKNTGLKTELSRFDDALKGRGKLSALSNLFDQIVCVREKVLPYLDALMRYDHLAVFGCNSQALSAVKEYVSKWKAFYDEFGRVAEDMREISDKEYQHAARCLLSLDVLFFRIKDEWKAITLPSNPLFLWIYSEVYGQINKSEYNLSDDELRIPFLKALKDLPNLINFQLVPREIYALSDSGTNDDYILPCSGSQGILPTFENKTNRYLGSDGMECIEDTINRYLAFAPYAGNDLRISFVDIPDVMDCVRIVSKSILDRSLRDKRKTSASLEIYLTDSHSGGREMEDLDFAKQDADVSELIKSDDLRIKVIHCKSVKEVSEVLRNDPVHLAFFFDQSTYQISYGINTKELYITPLVVTYDFKYDSISHDGEIYPNTDTESGFLGSYYSVLDKTGSTCSQSRIPRTTYLKTQELEHILDVVDNHYTQWLIVADRVVYNYVPKKGLPIGVKNYGRRNVCIWASKNSRVIQQFIILLKQYNLHPSQETLVEVFNRFGHISGEGLVGIPAKLPGASEAANSRRKGMLGTIFAAKWYADQYPNSLIASLDSNEGRTWISKKDNDLSDNNRADLVGFRLSRDNDGVIVDIIEVKTRGVEDKGFTLTKSNGKQLIKGHAVDQIACVLKKLKQVFSFDSSDDENMFVAARRETLKYQIVNECFRSKYLDATQILEWSERLKDVFKGISPVTIAGTILHIDLENNSDSDINARCVSEEHGFDVDVVCLTASKIQHDIFGELSQEQISKPISNANDTSSHSSLEENVIPEISEKTKDIAFSDFSNSEEEVISQPTQTVLGSENVQELVKSFRRACNSYSIRIAECDANSAKVGPSIIRFYLKLQTGQRIESLRRSLPDIGRQICRTQIRIQQVENTDAIAVDIVRKNREYVPFENVLSLLSIPTEYEKMPVLIGQTPEGDNIIRRLDEMPHLLVGGTTGSGKTVFLSTLLLSLLICHPKKEQLQLLITSSKPEDFIAFESLPHLMPGKILNSAADAVDYIKNQIFQESERRQQLFMSERVSKISLYNQHMREKGMPQLPPVVVLVDEFADLADNIDSRDDREVFFRTLRQIAQAGRSRGIHLILCTQRPSAKLLDTNIKAQLPGRVALMVADANSAKMILDTPDSGAERLQGYGDLLFRDSGCVLSRAQGYSLNLDNLSGFVDNVLK